MSTPIQNEGKNAANTVPPTLGTVDTVLAWVARYGLATVLTIVLLGYFLWTDYTRQAVLVPVIEQIADNQAAITRNLVEVSGSLKELQIQMRLSCGPSK